MYREPSIPADNIQIMVLSREAKVYFTAFLLSTFVFAVECLVLSGKPHNIMFDLEIMRIPIPLSSYTKAVKYFAVRDNWPST